MTEEKIIKQYIPHQVRSHPFRCIRLPLVCALVFTVYWFMICPLLYVSFHKDKMKTWSNWWPFAYWSLALLIFLIIMAVAIYIWRRRQRTDQIEIIQERDVLLKRKPSNVKELYHVTLSHDKRYSSNIQLSDIKDIDDDNKANEKVADITKDSMDLKQEIMEINVGEVEQTEDKLFPRCSVRRKPELSLRTSVPRPLSMISNVDTPISPLTPREVFFIDLIEAANTSYGAFIPSTQTFLEMERKNYIPDTVLLKNQPPVIRRIHSKISEEDSQSPQFFIANVPDRKSLTAEMFLFIENADANKDYRITMCESDDVFTDESCLLPSQVLIPQLQQTTNRVALASPQLAQQTLPLQLEYLTEPEFLTCNNDQNFGGQTVDCIRHLYLGTTPRAVKQCVRCGSSAGTQPVTRTAAIRAWDQRWIRSCQCGGLWRYHAQT